MLVAPDVAFARLEDWPVLPPHEGSRRCYQVHRGCPEAFQDCQAPRQSSHATRHHPDKQKNSFMQEKLGTQV